MIRNLPQSLIETAKKILTESTHPMIDVDGEMKHRHNSEGVPIHHTDEGIRNFHRWFGDAKTVDEHGRPKVFYHGTTGDITSFDPERAGQEKYSDWGKGVYFTPSKSTADYYRGEASKRIDTTADKLWDELESEGKKTTWSNGSPTYTERHGKLMDQWRTARKNAEHTSGSIMPVYLNIKKPLVQEYTNMPDPYLATRAKEKGHDGIVVLTGRGDVDEVVAFHPHQIKSALGNTGNFHPDSPRITESADGPRLHHVAEVKTNFPGADYYVVRKGTPDAVGKVTNEFSPEHIGVKITRTDILHPKYHQYSMQYAHMNGYWKEKAKGALRLQHISVDDVKNMPVVYRGLNEAAEYAPSTHHFDPDQIEKSRHVGYKSRTKLINMPIDDFLSVAQHTEGVGDKMDGVKSLINSGTKFSSIPQLYVDATDNNDAHKVYGHEGRHRALALKQRGYTHIPVHIIHSSIRWSEQSNPARFDYKEHWPTKLIGEDNRHTIEFPVKREDSDKSFSE